MINLEPLNFSCDGYRCSCRRWNSISPECKQRKCLCTVLHRQTSLVMKWSLGWISSYLSIIQCTVTTWTMLALTECTGHWNKQGTGLQCHCTIKPTWQLLNCIYNSITLWSKWDCDGIQITIVLLLLLTPPREEDWTDSNGMDDKMWSHCFISSA